MTHANNPLSGLRVVDFSTAGVGPFAAAMLGMLGAEVIKVEPPRGDFILRVMPSQRGICTTYLVLNTNKKCVVLDLKKAEDYETACNIVRDIDILIENLRLGVMDRLKLGYETVKKMNPRIIYCTTKGYGHKGEMAGMPATDPHMQAFSGFVSLNGSKNGEGEFLRYFGYLDLTTSAMIAQSALLAVLQREATGKGQIVETSMLQSSLVLQSIPLTSYLLTNKTQLPEGSASRYFVPDQSFQTKNEKVINVSVQSHLQWRNLCLAIGAPDLLTAENETFRGRVTHKSEIIKRLEDIFIQKPDHWWLRKLQRYGVPVGPVLDMGAIRDHIHFWKTGILQKLEHPSIGSLMLAGPPWKFNNCPIKLEMVDTEHGDEIRKQYGNQFKE